MADCTVCEVRHLCDAQQFGCASSEEQEYNIQQIDKQIVLGYSQVAHLVVTLHRREKGRIEISCPFHFFLDKQFTIYKIAEHT